MKLWLELKSKCVSNGHVRGLYDDVGHWGEKVGVF